MVFYVHSGTVMLQPGSPHDFGAYCECGIDWNLTCSVLLCLSEKKMENCGYQIIGGKRTVWQWKWRAEEGPDDGNKWSNY